MFRGCSETVHARAPCMTSPQLFILLVALKIAQFPRFFPSSLAFPPIHTLFLSVPRAFGYSLLSVWLAGWLVLESHETRSLPSVARAI
jgi:hypothetical protein